MNFCLFNLRKIKLFTRKIIAILLIGIIVIFGTLFNPFVKKANAAWFDESYAYRTSLVFTHNANVSNQKVKIEVDTATLISAGKMQADCGDTRFTDGSGKILPYYMNASGGAGVGCNDASTDYYVFMQTIISGNNIVYHYYGNPSAANGTVAAQFIQATLTPSGGAATAGSEEQAPAPAAYWKFDEGTGTSTSDSTSGGNTGTLAGSSLPTWQTDDICISGKCLLFNGSSSKVTVANTISGVKSLSFWAKPATTSASFVQLSSSVDVRASAGIITTSQITSPTIYVNGVLSNTISENQWNYITITTGSGITANAITLGQSKLGILLGSLDEVKFYPYVRTAAQVKADFNGKLVSIGGSSLGSNSQKVLSDGMVGYWKLEESASPAVDATGNSNSGTWTGAPSVAVGKFGNGIGYTHSSGDYISVTDSSSLSMTGSFSLAAWVKPTVAGGSVATRAILVKNNSYRLVTDGTGRPLCQLYNGSWQTAATSSVAITTGIWHHVACSYDQTTLRVYVNGIETGSSILTNAVDDSANALQIGHDAGGTYSDFVTTVDEARVYRRAFSPIEIAALYAFGAGPVGYWNFEEGSGLTANDTSGGGNTGTLSLGPTWGTGKIGSGVVFDGGDDYINTTNMNGTLTSATTMTVEAWINPKALSNTQPVLRKGYTNGNWFKLMLGGSSTGGSNDIAFEMDDGTDNTGYTTEDSIQVGNWYHVVAVYDGSQSTNATRLKIFINGVQKTLSFSGTIPTTTDNNTDPVEIGKHESASWNGTLDEVKIFNYVRTPKQVIEDMNGGHPAGGSPVGSQLGFWRFNEGYGTTTKNSVTTGILPGTITNATWTNSGKAGKALSFDGSGDYVDFGDMPQTENASQLTWSFWAKPTTLSTSDAFIGKANGLAATQLGWGISTRSDSSTGIAIAIPTTDTDSSTFCLTQAGVLANGTWAHVVVVFDGTKTGNTNRLKLYINGKVQSFLSCSGTIPASTTTTASNVRVGASSDSSLYYTGVIDEVKIYTSALTQQEILIDYNQNVSQTLGSAGNNATYEKGAASQEYCVPGDATICTSPTHEYYFEEHTGTTARDTGSGVTARDGTLTNGPVYRPGKKGGGINFDGVNDYLDFGINELYQETGAFTLSGWVYIRSFSPYDSMIICSSTGGSTCFFASANWASVTNGLHYCGSAGCNNETLDGNSASNVLTTNTWQHVAMTYNGSNTCAFYVNGVDVTADAVCGETSGGFTTQIGGVTSGTQYSTAIYDSMRTYDYVRTPAQIAWEYNKGGPVGWWRMDECTGTSIKDSSGNNNMGTLTVPGAGTQTAVGDCLTNASTAWYNGRLGKKNYSLNVDGNDDSVSVSDSISMSPTTAITISAWINPVAASVTGNHEIVQKNGSYGMKLVSGKFRGYRWGGLEAHDSITTLQAGTWYFVTMVYDGTTHYTYINGKLESSEGDSGSIPDTSNAFQIGTGTAGFYGGQIDDLQVYNYALNATQVKNIMNSGAVNFGPATGAP